ncbi:hypothetical protein ACFV4G_38465, partial [Kitasatospora sp. NPDC059747]
MTQPDFEAALREQLVATVADRTPGEAPYEAIRRQGRAARRRRTAAHSGGVDAVSYKQIRAHETKKNLVVPGGGVKVGCLGGGL